jgi:hypothetical protein
MDEVYIVQLFKYEISKVLTTGRVDNNFEPVNFRDVKKLLIEFNPIIKTMAKKFIKYVNKNKFDKIRGYPSVLIQGFLTNNMSELYEQFDENYILNIVNKVNRLSFIAETKVISKKYFISSNTFIYRELDLNCEFYLFVILYGLGIIVPDDTPKKKLIELIKNDKDFYQLINKKK